MNIHDPFLAKITAIADIASDTKQFSFEVLGEVKSFSAGQFFLLSVDQKISRAYSIASAPEHLPYFDLLIKKVPNGAATEQFLWKKEIGETIEFRGPMGRFGISPESKSKRHLLVATGTGLAPMRSLWQSLLVQKNPPEIQLLFGVRSEEFLFCAEEIAELKKNFSSFSATICLSRPEKSGDFFHGRVTDCMRQKPAEFFENTEISLCGSKEMVAEMKEILAEKNGNGKINIESW